MRTSWLIGLVAAALLALVVSAVSMLAGPLHDTWAVASQERDR
jgi:hypothetical protein